MKTPPFTETISTQYNKKKSKR